MSAPVEIRLSTHAIARYRQRVDGAVTFNALRALVRGGRFTTQKPMYVHQGEDTAGSNDAWVVTRHAVFPLRMFEPGRYLATTCLKRRRFAKADMRAMREARREEWAA